MDWIGDWFEQMKQSFSSDALPQIEAIGIALVAVCAIGGIVFVALKIKARRSKAKKKK